MNELSLFTGAGGGLLGTHLLGWRPIGYVEWNDYCQRVIAQRIADGILPAAPIFTDVREFVQSGAATEYRGFADVVTGGFPCQPFSVAGKRAGADDPRNMWPATIATIRAVRPGFAFLENVPGLVTSGYFGTILADLAQSGYDARWRILSAAEVGAPHKRDRLWILAADSSRTQRRPPSQSGQCDVGGQYTLPQGWQQGADGFADLRATVADTESQAAGRLSGREGEEVALSGISGQDVAHSQEQGLACGIQHARNPEAPESGLEQSGWWQVEPPLGRVVDGYAGRVDELKAIGNAQVASVVRAAWHLLTDGLL